ncbi:hypothetical protein NDU88_012603 [Pleurodeles waltl]|uniref:Uncharacterized protein n=1 Tax=Pleurodeles waltl TaxID=8319 RepID=A0AAV7R169_PLEWA|nr:hypothetical protein NDU88_012603 [Pleurodeles waltl]
MRSRGRVGERAKAPRPREASIDRDTRWKTAGPAPYARMRQHLSTRAHGPEMPAITEKKDRGRHGGRHRDAWTWLHAKGLAKPNNDEYKQEAWITPQPQRRKKPNSGTRPSKAQAAESQAQALKDANLFASAQCPAHREVKIMNSDSSLGNSSASTSPSIFGPELTPRTADDI